MIKPKQNCLVYHADGVCPGYPSPTTMKEKGKLVGVCNCQCHCDIQCFTDHDLTGCEHCQPSKEKEKFLNEWYKTHSIVDGPNELDYRNWSLFQQKFSQPSEEKELIKR